MMMRGPLSGAPASRPHVPVLLGPLIEALAPVSGVWVDGTFGAGGYTDALLEAGAARVIGIDRDPAALALGAPLAARWGERLSLVEGRFSELDRLAAEAGAPLVDGVVLDIGVSSMQLDQPERGFSFLRDGPLDMRMGGEGPSAADIVNTSSDTVLADILYHYGEERASRRIARRICEARTEAPITTTARLAEIVASCLPRPTPGQVHPATRTFQALRIAVNDELGELVAGLAAAERALVAGGVLAVVTFHSLEDRIVKRFFQSRAGAAPGASRHAPARAEEAPTFTRITRKPVIAGPEEVAANPRARSAGLRVGRRSEAPARGLDAEALGLPQPGRRG